MRAGLLAEYLSINGWSVKWWAPSFNHGKKEERFSKSRKLKVNNHEMLIALHSDINYKKNTSIQRVLFYKCLAQKMRKAFSIEKAPDVIFCSWPALSFASEAIKYGKEKNIPVVLDVRDLWPDIFIRVFPNKMERLGEIMISPLESQASSLLRKATAITGVTPSALEWGLRKAKREKSPLDRVVYIGYKDEKLAPETLEKELQNWASMGITESTFNFTYFGTFSSSTLDMVTVIRAFNKLSKENLDVRLVLCGDGDAFNEFKQAAKGNTRIIFPGWCSNSQIQSILQISNVGLYPFRNLEDFKNAFGNKIIGYLAAGIPVITSLKGFPNLYLKKYDSGKNYVEGDPDSCYQTMKAFSDDIVLTKRMGENARKRFEKEFDMKVVNGQLDLLLSNIIDSHSKM